uniref:Metallo-dependent protein n=1 Tax=Tetraselmis sp. GSL018 TaxID=582737 RepID=A0A061S2J1_9CHLO|mmetsp:Transcript_19100/g.45523  ORF Transcript_19100/g.45523 Transcript_19100/m.45523 type:complete len:314 (+) Transcript_19100:208-1149(+)
MRVLALSDVHTDHKQNQQWVEELSSTDFLHDVLVVAGDISDQLHQLRATLISLREKFLEVFFCPGNHDLWHKRDERLNGVVSAHSIDRLQGLLQLCCEIGVKTEPAEVNGVWICPIFSWYHSDFDREPDIPGAYDITKVMSDFSMCEWPEGLSPLDDSLARHFDALNDPAVSNLAAELRRQRREGRRPPVITFSHFLPLQELLPEKRMLFHPNLAKACGSDWILPRIRELSPLVHVFGHTHFNWDAEIDGVRYIQRPLGYPRERRHGDTEMLTVYDTEKGLPPPRGAYWSDHYKHSRREPEDVTPSPWTVCRS